MMGAGPTLRDAVEDFRALPEGAPERAILGPLLVQLQQDLPRMTGITVTLTPEEADNMMSYEEAVRIWNESERDRRETREQMRIAQEQLAQIQQQVTQAQQQATEAQQQATQAHQQATRVQRALEHQFERRLHRNLTDSERATVRARFTTLGPERLSDVVLDLADDALAAWIADPNAG